MLFLLKWFLAVYHLSERAVCELSEGKGLADDYHDYEDSAEQRPYHFTTLTCVRCGKEFTI